MRRRLSLFIVMLAILCTIGLAQASPSDDLYNANSGVDWAFVSRRPVNANFADGLRGWYPGHADRHYRLVYERHGFYGQPCVELAARWAPDGSWQCVVQNICAVDYRGKRVRISGWMKTANVDDISFGLRLDAKSKTQTLMSDQVSGTTDWRRYDVTFDVPDDAQGFAVAPGNLGTRGRFWLADVHVDVLDKTSTAGRSAQITKPVDDYQYPGDTSRVVHIWMLSRRGDVQEGLAEAEAIADDPTAGKEERCTAVEGVATLSSMLGRADDARKELDQFDAMSKDLNIDPGVVAEAGRVRDALDNSTEQSASSRWRNANGNDWTDIPSTPRNLSFVDGLDGWEKGSDYSDAPDYTVGVRRTGYRGLPVAFLRSTRRHPSGYAVLCQWLRADDYLGKRVRISGEVRRTGKLAEGSLYAHLDTRTNYAYWNVAEDGMNAGRHWRRFSIVIDVPVDGQGILFGGWLDGPGALWLADLRVGVVGEDVPLTPGGVVSH